MLFISKVVQLLLLYLLFISTFIQLLSEIYYIYHLKIFFVKVNFLLWCSLYSFFPLTNYSTTFIWHPQFQMKIYYLFNCLHISNASCLSSYFQEISFNLYKFAFYASWVAFFGFLLFGTCSFVHFPKSVCLHLSSNLGNIQLLFLQIFFSLTIFLSLWDSFIFNLFIFNWRIITLWYCVGFWHTSTLISHKYTYILMCILPLFSPHARENFFRI